ncbi:MAG TPA: hypothetical protein VK110_01585 [Salinisphaeraceae bacterium]|nr:hypothetical protein [Salinisphaeraceae bacterium]
MKYLFLLGLLFVLYLLGKNFIRRKLRGEPEPQRSGPKNITLLAGAIVLVYGVWMVVRLLGS